VYWMINVMVGLTWNYEAIIFIDSCKSYSCLHVTSSSQRPLHTFSEYTIYLGLKKVELPHSLNGLKNLIIHPAKKLPYNSKTAPILLLKKNVKQERFQKRQVISVQSLCRIFIYEAHTKTLFQSIIFIRASALR